MSAYERRVLFAFALVALLGRNAEAARLFWTDHFEGTISAINGDGTEEAILVTGRDRPGGIEVFQDHIYWIENNGIWRAQLDGTGVEHIVKDTSLPFSTRDIAIDPFSYRVFWTVGTLGGKTIGAAELSGDNVQQFLTGRSFVNGLSVDEENGFLYFTEADGPGAITLQLSRVRLDGTDARTLRTNLDGVVTGIPQGIEVVPSLEKFYVAGQRIGEFSLDASEMKSIGVKQQNQWEDVEYDEYGEYLYFSRGNLLAALSEKTSFGRLLGNKKQDFVKTDFQAANVMMRWAKSMNF